jgi:Fe-S-cluster-containing dehydrogenase component
MKKWNLIVDLNKCNGCFNCFLATKDEHVGNAFPGYAAPQPLHGHEWISIKVHERGAAPTLDLAYLPVMCNHCDDAPCVKVGKGAVTKRADGIVLIDPERARGRRDLVDSCPYGSIWWNEEEQLPQTWFFDAHLLDQGWSKPRCVQACGTGAMEAVKLEGAEMADRAQREQLEVLRPELGTQPRVYYRNLYRANTAFVAGTVTSVMKGRSDVVVGAHVTLEQGGRTVAHASTDCFGEFRFDRLPANSGRYRVDIAADGLAAVSKEIELHNEACVLGVMELRAV